MVLKIPCAGYEMDDLAGPRQREATRCMNFCDCAVD